MIKRKFYARLEKFYSDNGRYALLVDGARQVGKTFLIEEFARSHYENVIEINFIKEANARLIFQNIENESEILEKLSAYSHKALRRGQTLVFLDEIQECPEAVTFIKFLVERIYRRTAKEFRCGFDFVFEKKRRDQGNQRS